MMLLPIHHPPKAVAAWVLVEVLTCGEVTAVGLLGQPWQATHKAAHLISVAVVAVYLTLPIIAVIHLRAHQVQEAAEALELT